MPYDLAELRSHLTNRAASKLIQLASPGGVLLYGCGGFGRDVLAILRQRNIKVVAFIDGIAKEARECDGITVHPLGSAKATELAAQGLPLLISIYNHFTNLDEVVTTLRARGFAHVITPMELYDNFSAELGSRYWLAPTSHFLEHADSFLAGADLWADERSRDLYRRMLWYRFGWDLAAHPEPEGENQYGPADVPSWPQPVQLLDGGACEGDAVKTLLKCGYRIDQLYAWEPDLGNFEKLQRYLHEECPTVTSTLFPCGLGSRLQTLRFDGGRGPASTISEDGKDQLIVLPADMALTNHPVSLIKLDIEGAEADALHGMRRLIDANKPGMAVCVYHRPNDIFELPELIRSWNPAHRFYLRVHCWNAYDLVMYAIPA